MALAVDGTSPDQPGTWHMILSIFLNGPTGLGGCFVKRQFRWSCKPALVAKLLGGQTLDTVLKLQPDCLGLPLGVLAIFSEPLFWPFLTSKNGGVGNYPHSYVVELWVDKPWTKS